MLSALAAKAKDVAEYLDKMADKARSRNDTSTPPSDTANLRAENSPAAEHILAKQDYRGLDPETATHGDGADEDQGT